MLGLRLLVVGYELVRHLSAVRIVILELALAALSKFAPVHVIKALMIVVGLVMPIVVIILVIAHARHPLFLILVVLNSLKIRSQIGCRLLKSRAFAAGLLRLPDCDLRMDYSILRLMLHPFGWMIIHLTDGVIGLIDCMKRLFVAVLAHLSPLP